jgi:DNA-binding MarR family transcriptional regulator
MAGMPVPTRPTEELTAARLTEAWGAVRRRLRRGARAAVGGQPLTTAQVELLRIVEVRPGIGVGDAAASLHLAGNTVSTLVRGLVAADLLARRPDPQDGRAVCLALTATARRRLRRWRDERGRLLADALSVLSPDDVAVLEASVPALERLLVALETTA